MQQDFITSGNRKKQRLTESLSGSMAAGLVRVAVLLWAVVAVTRAQTWHSHGKPPGTWIQTALAPLTQYNGNIWFGVSSDGFLYERYHDTGVWYWRIHGIPISSGQFPNYSYGQYHEEPCALEGENEIHLMGTDGKLFGRYLSPNFGWSTTHHGAPFGYSDIIYASGCSSVKKPALKARTFMRGTVGQGAANGYLFELQEVGPAVWEWRWHWRPFDRSGSTYVAYIKTTSYALPNGYSYVFVVGTDGNMWQRVTHQNGWGRWYNRGKPAGKTIRHIHATRYGLWWAITTDGSVCRFHGGWPCFPPPNGFVRDCSDPFYVGNGLRSMFCITDDDGAGWTPENSLYQFFVGWDPATAEWGEHGIPASNQYVYVDRPNVAFASNPSWPVIQTPKSVFVPSTEGVYEWR